MNRLESIHQEILTRYTYDSHRPKERKEGYWVYDASHNDLRIPMTLKVIQKPSESLIRYLRRIKEAKIENVIKIFELF